MPSTGRQLGWWASVLAVALVGLYVALPRIAGLDETWGLLSDGDPRWLAAAVAFEVFAAWLPTIPGVVSYVRLRREVADSGDDRSAVSS